MPPRTQCPDGHQCKNYDSSISAAPDTDGCFGNCQRTFEIAQQRHADRIQEDVEEKTRKILDAAVKETSDMEGFEIVGYGRPIEILVKHIVRVLTENNNG